MEKPMICAERMYLTKDRDALVHEDSEAKAFLYASPGDEIPHSAVERFKLKDGKLPKAAKSEGKKSGGKKSGGTKDGKKPADKDGKVKPSAPPVLTDIDGIGPATVEALAKAGINDVAALAAVDVANLPAVEGLPPAFDWGASIVAAGALVPVEPAPAVQGS